MWQPLQVLARLAQWMLGVGIVPSALPTILWAADAEWTVMVFMNADNNLEPDGIHDFLEMAKVGSDDKVHVVVQFDRTPGWGSVFGDWTNTLRFRVKKDMQPVPQSAVEDIGEADMGSGDTLAQFVNWAMDKYPAKHYRLDIWDHGQGWRFYQAVNLTGTPEGRNGLAKVRQEIIRRIKPKDQNPIPPDQVITGTYRYISIDSSSGTKLFNRDMQDSLKQQLAGKKLDVVAFDACLMSMLETAYAMREVASVMAGSEELEPGAGWNYEKFLTRLQANPTADAKAVGKMLVDAYRETYSGFDETTTFSACDLTKTQELADSVSQMGDACRQQIGSELSNIKNARMKCLNYGADDGLHSIDLGHFVAELEASMANPGIKSAAAAVRNNLNGFVIANYVGTERGGDYGSTGCAIYFPHSKSAFMADPDRAGYQKSNTYYPVEFVQKFRWADFLQTFFDKIP